MSGHDPEGGFAYPSRSFITSFERRFQDLEMRLQNMHRIGQVKEVKYDKEKKRWFAKMVDGPGKDGFESDWLPWNTFAHGGMQVSVPPKVGQSVQMQSPGGNPETAVMSAYHTNPDNPSPSDKEDEVVIQFTKPKKKENSEDKDSKENVVGNKGESGSKDAYSTDAQQKGESTLRVKATNDGFVFTMGKVGKGENASATDGDGKDEDDKKTFQMTVSRDGKTITNGKFKAVIGKDGAKMTWGDKVGFELKDGQIEQFVDGAKQTLTKDNIVSQLGDAKQTMTKDKLTTVVGGVEQVLDTAKFQINGGAIKHDSKNIGKDHIHAGVQMGPGKTQAPEP